MHSFICSHLSIKKVTGFFFEVDWMNCSQICSIRKDETDETEEKWYLTLNKCKRRRLHGSHFRTNNLL